jgi:enamine deaminase RidA (YjgF/YER057c/UK114 family)
MTQGRSKEHRVSTSMTDRAQASANVTVRGTGPSHRFVVAAVPDHSDPAEAATETYGQVADRLGSRDWSILHERVFGSLGAESQVLAARSAELSRRGISERGPVTYVQGRPPWGDGLAGVIIHAVRGGRADRSLRVIRDGTEPRGRLYRASGVSWFVLQGLSGAAQDPRPIQVATMIERADTLLKSQGAVYRHIARTWFYIADILDWYDAFNAVRTDCYHRLGLWPSDDAAPLLLPASTGVQGRTARSSAGVMDLLAVAGCDEAKLSVTQLCSPGQEDAYRYGSAFSRGAVIRTGDTTLIQVSGTAAIDEHGRSLYPNDPGRQIGTTLDKVEMLLRQAGVGLGDICAATAFVKKPEYAAIFARTAADRGLAEMPVVCVVGDICREELAFELDAEAMPGSAMPLDAKEPPCS